MQLFGCLSPCDWRFAPIRLLSEMPWFKDEKVKNKMAENTEKGSVTADAF